MFCANLFFSSTFPPPIILTPLLQMAYKKVDEEAVYKCTGNPLPEIIRRIVEVLLNEEFPAAYQEVLAIKTGSFPFLSSLIYIYIYI